MGSKAKELSYLGPLKATISPGDVTHLHTGKYGVGIPSLFKYVRPHG
jgi:hypothetical protein